MTFNYRLGARLQPDGSCLFRVWANKVEHIDLCLGTEGQQCLPMQLEGNGTFVLRVPDVQAGTRYTYAIAGNHYPDPASRSQPDGVHGPSEVVADTFDWSHADSPPVPLQQYILYELHVGTFTAEGTFEAVIPHLDRLKDLGITALELMPVGQFPGARNWGYDGVLSYAAQNSYGGVQGLKRLVDACHQRGLSVVLDVVYNHLGPEGNYLSVFGDYFTDRYHTPWGDALNFDGPHSDFVRHYFIENALYWLDTCHVDALRLDATHELLDFSAYTFLEELVSRVEEWAESAGRRVYLIAENDRSSVRVLQPQSAGGYGLDAQWLDDLHHVLHTLLTGERRGYYLDYGRFDQLVKVLQSGFAYSGNYSPFRQRRTGTSAVGLDGHRFVVCTQNHDQVGNRMLGERLSALVGIEAIKLAAGVVLWSPYLPLIFMGEEYGETAPFLFFTDYGDPALIRAVQDGRAREFAAFANQGAPPDPNQPSTFERSKLNHDLHVQEPHQTIGRFYQALLRLRRTLAPLHNTTRADTQVWGVEADCVLFVHRCAEDQRALILYNLHTERTNQVQFPFSEGAWRLVFHSWDAQWCPQPVDSPMPLDMAAREPVLTLPPGSFCLFVLETP